MDADLKKILDRLDGIDATTKDTARKVDSFDQRLSNVEGWASTYDRERRGYVTRQQLDNDLARIDPTHKKRSFWKAAGVEVGRAVAIIGVAQVVRWIFSPSKKAQQLAPTSAVDVSMPAGGRARVSELRPN